MTDSAVSVSAAALTDTTAAAKAHARAQSGTQVDTMPLLPASDYPNPPAGVSAASLSWAETIAAGNYSSKVLARGTTLMLTDRDGDSCATIAIFNADQTFERLNVADTQKVPWQAYLQAGHPLLSDQGRVLATILAEDAEQHHDAICGASTKAGNEGRYGDGSVFGPSPASREMLKLAAAKHGLTPRDLPNTISFFKGVRVESDGSLAYTGAVGSPDGMGAGTPGTSVTLRIELPAIVLIANAPHRLDPRDGYHCTPLEVLAWRGAPTTPNDPLWSSSPELERAFLNTSDYAFARGLND